MNLKIINTADGSKTLYSEKHNEHYGNINGVFTEAVHIFINLGLKKFEHQNLNILEIGYGSGLNAILTWYENQKLNNKIYYHGIDTNPIDLKTAKAINHFELLENNIEFNPNFYEKWEEKVIISENFQLFKEKIELEKVRLNKIYNLIYFDAFSPKTQPELWTTEIFKKLFENMSSNSYLVTYSSKGIVKQALRQAGFEVKRFSGPLGKRHIICANKL
ncbi:MAG TPA: tRNA (5-methylaminomethyl-2-thiouridine)(34)-methyltransferase MnmD [Bacteroidales bacterium]|mgnify:CR=1 FL=1|nr:tRNA (5-methylaminomethyl-2-thiouridine)(34)-methyltransferase MnmD [Bacteroidales bacterium]HPX76656.1 tRNA (5-methylaminomethyl-2-thiouridine)(34)-methyltransferase MnmD [Bacteroidales bacterium]